MDFHVSGDTDCYEWIELEETSSTNDYLRLRRAEFRRRMTVASAEYQSGGRGATGQWLSVRGANLLFSLLIHPSMVEAGDMFILSEAICLSVCQTLNAICAGFKIKWPNDIYYGDQKVVGILIENELVGKCVSDCVIGVGVNVNQREFDSALPNPTSLSLILGREIDKGQLLVGILKTFSALYAMIEQGNGEEIREEYLMNLYRKDECHTYKDSEGLFEATMQTVEPSGHLLLLDAEGSARRYAFKEVQFVT